MTDGERQLAQAFIERAETALAAAAHSLEGQFVSDAVSNAYYAALYAAKSLLATRGLESSRHSAVIRLLGREFIAPGLLDKGMSRTISMLLESRLAADYQAVPTFSREEAEEHLEQARAFVVNASVLLDRILAEA